MSALDPQYYEEHSTFQKTVAHKIIKMFTPKKTDHILDIGCGDGYLSAQLAKLAPMGMVLGVDPSKEMIEYAMQTYQKVPHQNLEFELGFAESNHGIDTYHLITAFNCLHWSYDLEQVFESCHRALKNKGRFIGVTYPTESVYWDMLVEVTASSKWRHVQPLTPIKAWSSQQDYQKLASNNCFKTLFFQAEESLATYSDRKELAEYIKVGYLVSCLLI